MPAFRGSAFSFPNFTGRGPSGSTPRAVAFSPHPSCLLKSDSRAHVEFQIDVLTAGSSNTHYGEEQDEG